MNNKSLSDLLYVNKNSIINLFDELLRDRNHFKYVLTAKLSLKKHINNN